MKKPVLFSLIVILATLSFAFKTPPADAIVGKWKEESGVKTIEIYPSGEGFSGKIIANEREEEDKLTVGTMIMENFIYNEEEHTWEGRVIVPTRDMNLRGEIIMEGPDQIKSIAKIAIISKSKIWNRIK